MKERHKYIFPNPMAKMMKNVDMKTQYESSLMSMALLLIGMILMSVYTMIYVDQGMVFKVLIVINLIAGFVFMFSFMITTYQQYCGYLDALEIQNLSGMKEKMPESQAMTLNNLQKIPTKKNRKNQFLFFGGLLLILAGIAIAFMNSTVVPQKNIITLGCVGLGVLMAASVFIKKKPKTTQIGTSQPNQSNEKEKKEERIEKSKPNRPNIFSKFKSLRTKKIKENIEDNKETMNATNDMTYNQIAPNPSQSKEMKRLMEEVKSGLESLKSIPNDADNAALRKMIADAVKSKMNELREYKNKHSIN